MEEYEFMSIDEINRAKCCVKKQQNVNFVELFITMEKRENER